MSWLALLTTTTLGSRSHILRAEVRGDLGPKTHGQTLRLVVQIYPHRAVVEGQVQPWARPYASAQRAVTHKELLAAVPVYLVNFQRSSLHTRGPTVVVAWVEPGVPDLELDGANARPDRLQPWTLASLRPGQRLVKLRFSSRRT